ncbi:hypothetical protein myaer102_23590 [Microcystis viridis NIES-102]|uniref:Uncharacterized protein n=1 Tax=Microcystis viridis NIES-102 TaxID=213615 RepID=A0A3G9K3H8_MICVR|nr:hypothetical protein [Microcystis viridis]BBH39815.1 hypothetical protein myaer102_23590 [Microcystis viridis NIES-102]
MEVAQHPYKTQILDFHSCKTQWATRSLYFEGQKRNQFCILHYRLNLELLQKTPATDRGVLSVVVPYDPSEIVIGGEVPLDSTVR